MLKSNRTVGNLRTCPPGFTKETCWMFGSPVSLKRKPLTELRMFVSRFPTVGSGVDRQGWLPATALLQSATEAAFAKTLVEHKNAAGEPGGAVAQVVLPAVLVLVEKNR